MIIITLSGSFWRVSDCGLDISEVLQSDTIYLNYITKYSSFKIIKI